VTGQAIAKIQPAKVPALKGYADSVASKEDAKTAQLTVNEYQRDTAEIDSAPDPFAVRATLWTCAGLVAFVIAWASFSMIDRLVSARGNIVSITPHVVVQPLEAAIIRSIHVRVGDRVKAGEPLATLDPTFADANIDQLDARLASIEANIARLEAERDGRRYVGAPSAKHEYNRLQTSIFEERQTQFSSQMRLYQEKIAQAEAGIQAREEERSYLSQRLKILRQVEEMRSELERAQTGSKLNSLIATDSRLEIERNLSRAATAIIENRHQLAGIEAERDVFRRQWDSRIVEELVQRGNERDALVEQLVRAQRRKEMVQLTTPVDAIVLEIAQRSVGSVIREAEPFARLVPVDALLEVEANIPARQIGFIASGDPVRIKLDAFNFQQHGIVEGVVKVISSDSFTDNRTSSEAPEGAYYRARIELTKTELRNVPDTFRLIPGMPLEAEIKVGSRSVIAYFLRPLLRGVNESMREP
jgi:hemolysin D